MTDVPSLPCGSDGTSRLAPPIAVGYGQPGHRVGEPGPFQRMLIEAGD